MAWNAFFNTATGNTSRRRIIAAAPGKGMGVLPGADDVTDVQPREPGEPRV